MILELGSDWPPRWDGHPGQGAAALPAWLWALPLGGIFSSLLEYSFS
jgi:hypothetical protein